MSGPGTVRIKRGKFFRQDGEQVAVLVDGESPEFLKGPAVESFAVRLLPLRAVLFTECDDVEVYAVGCAVWMITNFKFPSASVIDPTGKTIFTYAPSLQEKA